MPLQDSESCCVYCGDWYECRDHFIPVSWASVYRTYHVNNLVHSCRKCNSILGDKVFGSMEERSQYVLEEYEERTQWLMRFPEWTQDELDELDWGLKCLVESKMALKYIAKAKIANLRVTSYGGEPAKLAYIGNRSDLEDLLKTL